MPDQDRSKVPFTSEWIATQAECWDAYDAKRDEIRKIRDGRASGNRQISLPVSTCLHVGEPLTIREVQDLGLNPRRKWHRCEKGLTKNNLGIAGVACSCEGCNSKCEGYERQ